MKLRLRISQDDYKQLTPKHLGMSLGDYGIDKEGFFVSLESTELLYNTPPMIAEYERNQISAQDVIDHLQRKLEEMGRLGHFTSHMKLIPEMHIVDDLGLDSLDIVELTMAIEDQYNIEIPDDDIQEAQYIQKIIDYILRRVN